VRRETFPAAGATPLSNGFNLSRWALDHGGFTAFLENSIGQEHWQRRRGNQHAGARRAHLRPVAGDGNALRDIPAGPSSRLSISHGISPPDQKLGLDN
jgi:hypothetical protein